MKTKARYLPALLALIVVSTAVAGRQVICKKECIDGLDDFCARSHSIVGANTTNLHHVRIYVERDSEGILRFGTNYVDMDVPASHSQSDLWDVALGKKTMSSLNDVRYPTKMVGFKELDSIEQVVVNLAGHMKDRFESGEAETIRETMRNDMTVYVDRSVLKADGTTNLNFDGVRKIMFIDGAEQVPAEVISTSKPPPFLASRIVGCCVKGRPPSQAKKIAEQLAGTKFSNSKMKIVSLVVDTETEEALKRPVLSSRVLRADPLSLTDEQLTGMVRSSQGQTLVLLGHVEGDSYVVRSADQKTIHYSVKISRLQSIAEQNNVQLIHLGCRSATAMKNEFVPLGVAEEFRPTEALQRLGKATETATNMSEFLQGISDEKLTVIVDPDAFSASEHVARAGIYRHVKSWWVRVAELGLVRTRSGIGT
jgi:hypothetical protein